MLLPGNKAVCSTDDAQADGTLTKRNRLPDGLEPLVIGEVWATTGQQIQQQIT